ncbi:MAG TPA: RodZ domain-containing protein, partial [Albitalea sp.]|nr:RodZ domain-containing protein [Albitalea sp.]
LSAAIKVSQKKLEALEADRLDELPDATFTRALAQTVCRALKIDPSPVLALLPAPAGQRLEHVGEGINAPFRDRPGRHEPKDWSTLGSPAVWGPLLIVLGAGVLYLLPAGWLSNLPLPSSTPPASAPAASAAAGSSVVSINIPAEPAAPPVEPTTAAAAGTAGSAAGATMVAPSTVPAVAPASPPLPASAAANPAAPVTGMLQLRTKAASWIEVQDARSKVLVSRLVQADETLALDGVPPLRLKIGNAGATEVVYRGHTVDLAASTRDNVARLELK